MDIQILSISGKFESLKPVIFKENFCCNDVNNAENLHCKCFALSESWLYLCLHVTPQCTPSDSWDYLLLAVLTHFALLWAMPTLCKGSIDKDFH